MRVHQMKDVRKIVPRITEALSRFTSQRKTRALEQEIIGIKPASPDKNLNALRPTLSKSGPNVSDFAQKVSEILEECTPLAWPVLEQQCNQIGVPPEALTPKTLRGILPNLETGIARFTSKSKGRLVAAKLAELTTETSGL